MEWSMRQADRVNPQLLLIRDVLPQAMLDKLQALLQTDITWKPVWKQPDSRKMIDWIAESVIEELHCVGELLTPVVCECFGINGVHFQALQLWKDHETYDLSQHQDNPVIDVAMQIYLYNDKDSEGTTFVLDGELDVPFNTNTGYVLWKKSNDERIPHRVSQPVTGSDRITLYLTWSRFGKQAPEADDPSALL